MHTVVIHYVNIVLTPTVAQWEEYVTSIHEIRGPNPSGEQTYFCQLTLFCIHISFEMRWDWSISVCVCAYIWC